MSKPYAPRLIAIIVAAALFMGSLDQTVIATALPQMARAFHRPPVDLSLAMTLYILVMAAFLPVSTWVADRLGARKVFAGAIIAFAAASALCGLSPNLELFIGARVLQALAATLMAPVGNLVLFRSTEKKDLVAAVAISTTPGLVAPVIGPAIGGFIVTFLAWPWIFFLNIPIAVVGVALALRYIPDLKAAEPRPFDWRGFWLTGLALGAFIYGLDRISTPGGDWRWPAALIALGLGLGFLAIRHSRRAPHPLLSLEPLKIPTFRVSALTGGTLIRIPFRALGFALPLMFQAPLGMTAFQSGILVLGYNGGDLILKSIAGRALKRMGFRRALSTTAVISSVATATWLAFGPSTPFWAIFAVLVLSGMARSILMTAMVSMTFADVPHEEIGQATVLSNVLNQTTGAVGIGIAALILNLSSSARGAAGHVGLADCRVTLMVMAMIGLSAVPSFLSLPHDAGAEVSGHRPRTDWSPEDQLAIAEAEVEAEA
jgi:EmrB/QacA subfamily drug resistance transporter